MSGALSQSVPAAGGSTPQAVVIAGANGAGKTTFARQFLPLLHPGVPFLNVDEIQRESTQFAHPVAGAKEFLRRLHEREQLGLEFCVETTLSSSTYAGHVRRWRSLGYRPVLHFIELPSEDFAVARVQARVAAGGHAIAEQDIRRRFFRGKELFQRTFRALVPEWYHWFSDEKGIRLVQSKSE